MPLPSIRNRSLPIIGLILLAAGIYLQTLRYDFVWDDHRFISGMAGSTLTLSGIIEQAGSDLLNTGQLTYRPLFELFFRLDGLLWGENPAGFHLTNILLHVLVTLLVYRFLHQWTGSTSVAWLSAAVFAVHPVHVESVAWISGRADLWTTLFVMLAFLSVFRSWSETGARAWGWSALGGVSFILALMVKETALVLPGLIAVVAYSKKDVPWKRVLPALSVSLLISLVFLVSRSTVLVTVDQQSSFLNGAAMLVRGSRTGFETALAVFFITGEYLRLLLFPVSLKPVYDLPTLLLTEPAVLRSIGLVSVWIAALGLAVRRRPMVAAAMAWVIIGLFTSYALLIYTSVSPLGERLLYLPSVGFSLLLGMMFSGLRKAFGSSVNGQRVLAAIGAILLTLYAAMTIVGNTAWSDDIRLWERSSRKNPNNSLVRYNLATAYYEQGRWPEAIQVYEETISIQAVYPSAHYNMANAWVEQGRRDLAIPHYETAVRQDPGHTDAYINLGITYHELNRDDLALKALLLAVRSNPENAAAHNNLANVYTLRGNWKTAIQHYETALSLQPEYPEARINLDRALQAPAREVPQ